MNPPMVRKWKERQACFIEAALVPSFKIDSDGAGILGVGIFHECRTLENTKVAMI
jgi:hypothetical protein